MQQNNKLGFCRGLFFKNTARIKNKPISQFTPVSLQNKKSSKATKSEHGQCIVLGLLKHYSSTLNRILCKRDER